MALPDKTPQRIGGMFSSIAARYDRANRLLSFRQDKRWRARLVRWANPQLNQTILDLCTGTGDLAIALAQAANVRVTGIDISGQMLDLARQKTERAALTQRVQFAQGDALDLESRKGKAPGGYQYVRDLSRRPFIFMTAAGLHRDVETMVHEAGHAFHSLLCRDEPLVHYRHSPIEFAEVASMSMELLTMEFWDEFYPDEGQLRRAQREQLEGVAGIFPWVATIDAFQHWLYTNPGHTRDQRRAHWESLIERFGRGVSWEGLERFRAAQWRRQGRLFGAPIYYVEYAIAELAARQLWGRARREGLPAALDGYKRALALGGSRPLPELFEAAGIKLDFTPPTVERLMGEVDSALAELPA